MAKSSKPESKIEKQKFPIFLDGVDFEIGPETVTKNISMAWSFVCTKRRLKRMKLKPFYCEIVFVYSNFWFSILEIDLETIINGRSMPWSFGCTKRRPEKMQLKPLYDNLFSTKFSAYEFGPETIINGRSMPWSSECTKRRFKRMKLKPFYGEIDV